MDAEHPLMGSAIDALHRIEAVSARRVLRLLFLSIIDAHPATPKRDRVTRLRAVEMQLFGRSEIDADRLKYEEVMLFIYRKYLAYAAYREKTKADGEVKSASMGEAFSAETAAYLAVDFFHPELVVNEHQSAEDAGRRDSLARRYRESYYMQRKALPDRYYELFYDGDEDRIVANFLADFLGEAGLIALRETLLDPLIPTPREIEWAVERDGADQHSKRATPKK